MTEQNAVLWPVLLKMCVNHHENLISTLPEYLTTNVGEGKCITSEIVDKTANVALDPWHWHDIFGVSTDCEVRK